MQDMRITTYVSAEPSCDAPTVYEFLLGGAHE